MTALEPQPTVREPLTLTPEGVLALVREFVDEDAFLCEFRGVTAINAPNIDRVIVLAGQAATDQVDTETRHLREQEARRR